MSEQSRVTLRLAPDLLAKLDQAANAAKSSRTALAQAALEQFFEGAAQDHGLLASIDRLDAAIRAAEGRAVARTAQALAETNARLDRLENLASLHYYNTLAQTPPDPDRERATARGRERLAKAAQILAAIEKGEKKPLFDHVAEDADRARKAGAKPDEGAI